MASAMVNILLTVFTKDFNLLIKLSITTVLFIFINFSLG